MKMTVLGIRPVNFTASDGRTVTGTSIFAGYETEGVDGLAVEKIFVAVDRMPKKAITVGSDVEVVFNMKGKVEGIIND